MYIKKNDVNSLRTLHPLSLFRKYIHFPMNFQSKPKQKSTQTGLFNFHVQEAEEL